MRLPDPFTHPGIAQGFASLTLIDNDPMIRDEMPNGQVLETKTSAQYWGINIEYPDLFVNEFNFLSAFIGEYKRTGGYIDVLLPQYETFHIRGNTNGLTIPSGQAGSSIVINNILTAGIIGLPKPGDLFKLSNHYKVYKITVVNVSGNQMALGLYPNLFITTNGTEKPIFSGILIQTKLMNGDSINENINNDGIYSGVTLSLREAK